MSVSGDPPVGLDRFGEIVATFLAAPKSSARRMSWRSGITHSDYSRAQLKVTCEAMPRIRARVIMLAHTHLHPRKYSFTLLLGRTRIASLDTNPKRGHKNALQKLSIISTHWSFYPCDTVIPDDRTLVHAIWLA